MFLSQPKDNDRISTASTSSAIQLLPMSLPRLVSGSASLGNRVAEPTSFLSLKGKFQANKQES